VCEEAGFYLRASVSEGEESRGGDMGERVKRWREGGEHGA
jgi:hypothetical protein